MDNPLRVVPFSARRYLVIPGVYFILGLLLWQIPLFNILHAESSAVVAAVSFFTAGLSSLSFFRRGSAYVQQLAAQGLALFVPWLLLTLSLAWTPNCGYFQGLAFYVLFAVAGIPLSVSLAYAIHTLNVRYKRMLFVAAGVSIALSTLIYDLYLHPQFFVYNHVFGGVLGPIYDEELTIRPGLLAFRVLSNLWAVVLYLVGERLQSRSASRGASVRYTRGAVLAVLPIGLIYLFSAPLGLNTPAWYTQKVLGSLVQTEHFDIYYDAESIRPDDLERIAGDHEFEYERLAGLLELEVTDRIKSYLYPDSETKARLTGSRETSVAPVWLREPQLHVLQGAYSAVFPHELVHVFSREFGLPLIRASLLVGLVEGLAVALEPADGLPAPDEQVIAAALSGVGYEGGEAPDLAGALASTLSPSGFWTGRGAVSYTTMGSFVRYLFDAYGADRLKKVYATGAFEAVYDRPVRQLAAEWQARLLEMPAIASAAGPLVGRRFTIPSLFEKRCPHYLPPYQRYYRAALRDFQNGDTTQAVAHLERSLEKAPTYIASLALLSQVRLMQEAPEEVLNHLDTLEITDGTPVLAVAAGDAAVLLRRPDVARTFYEAAYNRLPLYAHAGRSVVLMRLGLLDRPEVIRVITSGAPPEVQAAELAVHVPDHPIIATLCANLLAGSGQYEQAADLLRTYTGHREERWPFGRSGVLYRQQLAWQAQYLFLGGFLDQAGALVEEAIRAYNQVGDRNERARLAHFASRIRWEQLRRTS